MLVYTYGLYQMYIKKLSGISFVYKKMSGISFVYILYISLCPIENIVFDLLLI